MAYKYKLIENAINDIDGIVNYITYSLCNKEAADSFLADLVESIMRTCDFSMGVLK